jgi:glutathione S-transferase
LELGLAEIATVCALGYLDLRYADYNWRSNAPSLLKLFDRLMRKQSFQQTVPTVQEVPANR